jgi:predicted GTPase
MPDVTNVIIMGAAGRDFHNFNVCYRNRPGDRVVAFTAAQIPNIAGRRYPADLAGECYPDGIPIHSEDDLEQLIVDHDVDDVVFAYSDIPHVDVMHAASRVLAAGASFHLLGTEATMLQSKRPVVAVCAVRTGAGKSPLVRNVVRVLKEQGLRAAVVRHPMPYGDLREQACQRFASFADLEGASCTIEEREEYEPHINEGTAVFAGVDYAQVLAAAEADADVIIWDGGNNDLPFFQPNVHIVLADALRPGHELTYHPGEANVRLADALIINKADGATRENIATIHKNLRSLNRAAPIGEGALRIAVDDETALSGREALVIEDGPTITHGGMPSGAGLRAVERFGATVVDPRPWASGSIGAAFAAFPHIGPVLPALGYSEAQLRDLEETIRAVPCDVVVVASPVDLRKLVEFKQPAIRVSYEFEMLRGPSLEKILAPIEAASAGH